MKAYALNKGYVWSPLTNYARNEPCLCGSGVKFKKCCYGKVKRQISKEDLLLVATHFKKRSEPK